MRTNEQKINHKSAQIEEFLVKKLKNNNFSISDIIKTGIINLYLDKEKNTQTNNFKNIKLVYLGDLDRLPYFTIENDIFSNEMFNFLIDWNN